MKKITNKIVIVAVALILVNYFALFAYIKNAIRNDTMLDFLELFFVIDDQTKTEGIAKTKHLQDKLEKITAETDTVEVE